MVWKKGKYISKKGKKFSRFSRNQREFEKKKENK